MDLLCLDLAGTLTGGVAINLSVLLQFWLESHRYNAEQAIDHLAMRRVSTALSLNLVAVDDLTAVRARSSTIRHGSRVQFVELLLLERSGHAVSLDVNLRFAANVQPHRPFVGVLFR